MNETTEAAVVQQVPGEVKVGLSQLGKPTPQWLRVTIRTLLYLCGILATIDFSDFGMSEAGQTLVLKYGMIFTAALSAFARFVGVSTSEEGTGKSN